MNKSRLIISSEKLKFFLFSVLLIISYIGISPLSDKNFDLELADTGGGNSLRQVIFIFLFIAVVSVTGIGAFKKIITMTFPIVIVFIFCILSIAWSHVPEISVRRVFLLLILSYSVMALVYSMNA
jgi:hypothetical protein